MPLPPAPAKRASLLSASAYTAAEPKSEIERTPPAPATARKAPAKPAAPAPATSRATAPAKTAAPAKAATPTAARESKPAPRKAPRPVGATKLFVLDTNVLSELRTGKPQPDAQVLAWAAAVPLAAQYVSVVTWME